MARRRLGRDRSHELNRAGRIIGHGLAWVVLVGFPALVFLAVYMNTCANPWNTEEYPRLVPWVFDQDLVGRSATVLRVQAQSYACKSNDEWVTETFDRVKVRETADTVTIETWVTAPTKRGFWQGCSAVVMSFPTVEVRLDAPLGARDLVDPACSLDDHRNWVVCRPGGKV